MKYQVKNRVEDNRCKLYDEDIELIVHEHTKFNKSPINIWKNYFRGQVCLGTIYYWCDSQQVRDYFRNKIKEI